MDDSANTYQRRSQRREDLPSIDEDWGYFGLEVLLVTLVGLVVSSVCKLRASPSPQTNLIPRGMMSPRHLSHRPAGPLARRSPLAARATAGGLSCGGTTRWNRAEWRKQTTTARFRSSSRCPRTHLAGTRLPAPASAVGRRQLTSQGFMEWRWDVVPTASGNHPLSIIVSVLHEKYPDGPIEEAPPFERRIDVSVNPGYSLAKWLSSNWEKPIFAVGGIIAIIEGYRRLWLRRAEGSGGVAPGRGLRRIPERRRTRNRPKRR